MTERRGQHPVSREVTAHLLTGVAREVSPADEKIGLMIGTGIDMMQRMRRTGYLSNGAEERREIFLALPAAGIRPRMNEVILPAHTRRLLADPQESRSWAEGSALYPAQVHHLVSRLGLPLDDPDLTEMAMGYLNIEDPLERNLEYSYLVDYVQPHLVPKIPDLAAEAEERKGFLVGVHKDAQFAILAYGDNDAPDLSVTFGQSGIPYREIIAVEPLGPHEEAYIESLRSL